MLQMTTGILAEGLTSHEEPNWQLLTEATGSWEITMYFVQAHVLHSVILYSCHTYLELVNKS